jgi:hypothetical protein
MGFRYTGMVEQVSDEVFSMNLIVSMYSFSQIPGLHSKNRKAKSKIRSSVKDARIPAAKRIGTQLASQTLKGRVSNTPTRDDDPLNAVDDGYNLDGNVLDLDGSSAEPASSDKEEHGLWKQREQTNTEDVPQEEACATPFRRRAMGRGIPSGERTSSS